jgi:hypothetical protein
VDTALDQALQMDGLSRTGIWPPRPHSSRVAVRTCAMSLANPLILLQASPEQGSPRGIVPSVAPAWARGVDRVWSGTSGEGTEQGEALPGKTERGEPRSPRQGSDWDVEGVATRVELCARRLAHAGQLGDDLA